MDWLLGKLEAKGITGAGTNETPKLHELFDHMADHIEEAGLANSFSTKLFETFHEILKLMLGQTTQRPNTVDSELLKRSFFYLGAIEEIKILETRSRSL